MSAPAVPLAVLIQALAALDAAKAERDMRASLWTQVMEAGHELRAFLKPVLNALPRVEVTLPTHVETDAQAAAVSTGAGP